MNYTIITGASKGIGKALALECAKRNMSLILVARSGKLLEDFGKELEATHGITVQTYAADLCRPNAARDLANYCQRHHYSVNALINNAGFGSWGEFEKISLEEITGQLQLNVTALTALTHALLPNLKRHKRAMILNVASIAGYFPMPYFSVYAASKAYVISLSRALRQELRKQGVSVSCLCPGPTQSEFYERAGMSEFRLSKSKVNMNPQDVAQAGIEGMLSGREIIIPGVGNKVSAVVGGSAPKKLVSRLVSLIYKPAANG